MRNVSPTHIPFSLACTELLLYSSKTVSKHADLKEPAYIEQGFKHIPAGK